MDGTEDASDLPPEAAAVLARLGDLDRVLPRSLEEWVAARERDGLEVPENLKRRLAEKARLRAHFREMTGAGA